MREVPHCLKSRYQALDELIKELTSTIAESSSCEETQTGIKLMCDFWNILQDDPDCNLTQEVQQRMLSDEQNSSFCKFGHEHHNSAGKKQDRKSDERRRGAMNRIHQICCSTESNARSRCDTRPGSSCGAKVPLSKVLCNLKEAASFEKDCKLKAAELVAAQKELTAQIQTLEEREKSGVLLLKQADNMWSCMEEAYKHKIANALDRQNLLLKELKDIEGSENKWRKNKKDIDFQLENISKCQQEIIEKTNQKQNDIKVIDMEIQDFEKRIKSNKKSIDVAKNSYKAKREASDVKIASIAQEIVQLQKKVTTEQQIKTNKEQEGTKYVKDAREDLQKICRVLLQKKLENEDLRAEKEALIQEIELMKKTCELCQEKCTSKEKNIDDETKTVDDELAQYKLKCTRCHVCTDTADTRKMCSDCPRCLTERDCLIEGNHCVPDHTMDCVCMAVKEKFMENVFDNMYTVLERQSKTCPGKAVADCILNCLKRSRNGKLDQETRKVLQDFILSTVKKNLNLTIIGGAAKTRCELDPETYQQLMLCLDQITPTSPPKKDRGTAAKKEPCRTWGGTNECNCPKGPKACICTKKVPPPPTEPTSCGSVPKQEESDICPHNNSLACGTDCGRHGVSSVKPSGTAVSGLHRDPCQGQSCPFSKNMRAAQCILGPEPLAIEQKTPSDPPIIPKLPVKEETATWSSGGKAIKPRRDTKHLKAEVKDKCNKGTCTSFYKQTKAYLQFASRLQDAETNPTKNQSVPSVQNDVLFQNQKQKQILNEYTREKSSNNETKGQFKTAVENETGQSNVFTELTKTISGRLAIELDEEVIELIEKKSKKVADLFMSLNRTDSGHMLIDFGSKENVDNKAQRVLFRRTSSGTRLLNVHKNTISVLEDTLPDYDLSKGQESPNPINTVKQSPPISSKKEVCQNHDNREMNTMLTLEDLPKEDKELGNLLYTSASIKSPKNSIIQSPKHKGKGHHHPSTVIKEGKIYERAQDSSSWKLSDTDKYSLRKIDKCVYFPSDSCLINNPPPPITYNSKPETKIEDIYSPQKNVKKDNLECGGPKIIRNSDCCIFISETNLLMKDFKTVCECPTDSQSCNSWKSAISNSVVSMGVSGIISELKQLYKKGNVNVVVKIRGKKGKTRRLPTVITRTPSDFIAIYGRNFSYLADIGFDEKEYPVLLSKTFSGTYFVDFGLYEQTLNATLRKTSSGGMLIVPKSKSVQKQTQNINGGEKFFTVKVTGVKNYPVELPAVLKTTPSDNYIILLDKEFEKRYRQTVNEYIGDRRECIVDLNKTNSGNYVIELDTDDETHLVKRNALLIKSSSGNIKVLVHGSEFESIVKSVSKNGSSQSPKAFGQLVNKVHASSREFHRENLRKSKYLGKETSSDKLLYDTVRLKLQGNKSLHSEPSIGMKKTVSGQYTIYLNKESKKAFINDLERRLMTNSQKLVPIKRSESGKIAIDLINKDKAKGHFRSLKITPSGNIYVVVDEDIINMAKGVKKNDDCDESSNAVDTRPKHVIRSINPTVNKAIATTDDHVCDKLQFQSNYRLHDYPPKYDRPSICKKVKADADYNNDKKYSCIAKSKCNMKDKSPHITIKPAYDSLSPTKKKFESTGQCYYLLDSVCPYHKNRYDAVSTKLMEVSGHSIETEAEQNKKKVQFKAKSRQPNVGVGVPDWDSLNNLPPQLPPFLTNFVID